MKHILITIIILVSVKMSSAQNSLPDYLETAAKNNPELASKFSDYNASLQVVPQVKVLPDPQISFGYFIIPVETRTGPQQFKISGSQFFPWFGTLKAKENAAIHNAKTKYEAFEQAKSDLFLKVRTSYYTLYYIEKSINITEVNLIILRSFKKLAAVKVEVGKASATDELRIDMEIAELENKLALFKDSFYSEKVKFNKLLNVDKESSIIVSEIKEDNFKIDTQTVLDSILVNNHDLKALDFKLNSLEYSKTAAEKEGMPKFSVGADYTFIGTGENNLAGTDAFFAPKIGVSIPLNRKKYKAKVSEVRFKQDAVKSKKENIENLLETALENVFKNYNDAERRIKLYENQTEIAKKTVRLLENEYAVSSVGFEEILRMERKVLNYNLSVEKAKSDKEKAKAQIYYLTGK
ncbi:MAG: TolC family protein [Bacteroidales bacterium]|nr:TolC family protein [Bacteroidales bacterium]